VLAHLVLKILFEHYVLILGKFSLQPMPTVPIFELDHKIWQLFVSTAKFWCAWPAHDVATPSPRKFVAKP
jgi:hypothetical protein